MPREYPASRQPEDLVHAENEWMNEGAKTPEKFYYEIRETREFSVEDIQEQLAVIYGIRPEDFGLIDIKKESAGGTLERAELHLKPEISRKLFGHLVSFDFMAEGRITKGHETFVTNISRNDFYDDGDVFGESLADYDRTTGKWKIQPGILRPKIDR